MRAILKSKHQRFCNWLQGTRDRLAMADVTLDELENGLSVHYDEYLQKREDLRAIIQQYEEKQNAIRNRIKQNRMSASHNNIPPAIADIEMVKQGS